MLKLTPLIAAACLLATGVAQAQQATHASAQAESAPAIATAVSLAPEKLLESATPADAMPAEPVQSYEDWVAAFEEQFGQMIGNTQDGRVFYAGFGTTSSDSAADPHYGTQLALAYERAMFDMQADFIMRTYGHLKAQTVRTLFDDQSSNKDAFDPVELDAAIEAGGGRLEAMLDKALTLVDKKLDNALVEEGVPAEDIQKLTVEQKKTLYKDTLNKNILKTAYQSMQGLVPVQTRIFPMEANGKKAMAVSVIAVQSEKTRQFAKDIVRKRPSLVTGSAKSLKDLLPTNKMGFLDEIGLRYTYDEAGRPMLLAYGRTSVPMDPAWSAARAVRAKQTAQQIAQAMAEANIVEFMNTNIRVSEATEIGDLNETVAKQITEINNGKPGEVQQVKEDTADTLQKFSKSGTATAVGDLRGTSVVRRWDTKDANGVVHVGTVVSWTYGQLDNANAVDAQARGKANAASGTASNGIATDQSRVSRTINSKDDF